MKLTIHQLEFMSYLGFWDKVSEADKIVLLDDVDFRKNYFQNRNQILMNGNPIWLGIETEKSTHTPIKDVKVSSLYNPTKKIKTLEQAYSKAPYFDNYAEGLIDILKHKRIHLAYYTNQLFVLFLDYLGIELEEIIHQSKEKYHGHKEDLILDICKNEGAKTYLSGHSGNDYLNFANFENEKIKVKVQDYKHPNYRQIKTEKFIPYMSIIDLIFNEGPNSLNILKNGK